MRQIKGVQFSPRTKSSVQGFNFWTLFPNWRKESWPNFLIENYLFWKFVPYTYAVNFLDKMSCPLYVRSTVIKINMKSLKSKYGRHIIAFNWKRLRKLIHIKINEKHIMVYFYVSAYKAFSQAIDSYFVRELKRFL